MKADLDKQLEEKKRKMQFEQLDENAYVQLAKKQLQIYDHREKDKQDQLK